MKTQPLAVKRVRRRVGAGRNGPAAPAEAAALPPADGRRGHGRPLKRRRRDRGLDLADGDPVPLAVLGAGRDREGQPFPLLERKGDGGPHGRGVYQRVLVVEEAGGVGPQQRLIDVLFRLQLERQVAAAAAALLVVVERVLRRDERERLGQGAQLERLGDLDLLPGGRRRGGGGRREGGERGQGQQQVHDDLRGSGGYASSSLIA